MKLLLFAFFIPSFVLAQSTVICAEEERVKPVIRKGEVKISYPCEAFAAIPAEAEKEMISFYEPKSNPSSLEDKGIIVRTRKSSESDATVKYRPKNGEEIFLDKLLYSQLGASPTADLKCESDVTYAVSGFKNVESCSLTTESETLNENHDHFLKMVGVKDVSTDLTSYKKYDIEAVSWKIKSPLFAKGISLEKWDIKNGDTSLCIFEVSAKFEVKKEPAATVTQRVQAEIKKSLANLKNSFPGQAPATVQGNKTDRAMDFLRSKY